MSNIHKFPIADKARTFIQLKRMCHSKDYVANQKCGESYDGSCNVYTCPILNPEIKEHYAEESRNITAIKHALTIEAMLEDKVARLRKARDKHFDALSSCCRARDGDFCYQQLQVTLPEVLGEVEPSKSECHYLKCPKLEHNRKRAPLEDIDRLLKQMPDGG